MLICGTHTLKLLDTAALYIYIAEHAAVKINMLKLVVAVRQIIYAKSFYFHRDLVRMRTILNRLKT